MPRTRSKPESEWMTIDDLPADARLRDEHAGQWVAWDHGMTRILASGSDLKTVHAEAIATGAVRPVLEFIPPVETRPAGTD